MGRRYKPEASMVPGPAGLMETAIAHPGHAPVRIALVAHPHPLHGGAMTNKVAQTLCKTLHSLGCLTATMNFRGVGQSEGTHDFGIGEAEDMAALAEHAKRISGDLPLILAGFSFGGGVQARASGIVKTESLLLVAPSVPRDVPAQAAESAVLCSYNDDVVSPGEIAAWSRENGSVLTMVPDAGHHFHGKLQTVSDWIKAMAAQSALFGRGEAVEKRGTDRHGRPRRPDACFRPGRIG